MAVNEVLYPDQLDTKDNFPDLDIVTQDSFVEINRNAEAIITIEEILGIDPHIGPFTTDPDTATVSQRISYLEEGMSSGSFQLSEINVANALIVEHSNGVTTASIGRNKFDTDGYGNNFGNVKTTVRGTMEVLDSSVFRVGAEILADRSLFKATSKKSTLGRRIPDSNTGKIDYSGLLTQSNIANNAIVSIQDTYSGFENDRDLKDLSTESLDHVALWVLGNVQIDGVLRVSELTLNHNALVANSILSTPVNTTTSTDASLIYNTYVHVKWGDWHSHVKKPGSFNANDESPRWEVEPTVHNWGIIDHKQLVGIHTTSQTADNTEVIGFEAKAGIAYHVTGGDGHDHDPAGSFGGSQVDHNHLRNNGTATGHVNNGNDHDHTLAAGAAIRHDRMLNTGSYTHTEIDAFIDTDSWDSKYLNQTVGGKQKDEYDTADRLITRTIFADTDATILLEQHSFTYDPTNTLFVQNITRKIYDRMASNTLDTIVTYTFTNNGTRYLTMSWTKAE